MPRKPTEGEEMFDKYLAENGLMWSPWPDSNERNPDRIVHTSAGDVVCEIKDFGENDEYRELIANFKAGKSSSGRSDLSKATAKRIWAALDQLAVVKDDRPTMVVLYNPGYMPHELHEFVLEALYGQPQIAVSIGPKAPAEVFMTYGGTTGAGNDYNKGLFLKPELAHVSAVAVLEPIRLNKPEYDSSLDAFLSNWEQNNPEDGKELLKVCAAIEEHGQSFIKKYGAGSIEAVAYRLRIYFNPNSSKSLVDSVFTGPYDEHFDATC